MADVIKLIGRLNAFRQMRAVRIATHLQVNIAPHGLVIAPLAMAGEDTTVHAVAVGRIGAPLKYVSCRTHAFAMIITR